MEKKNWREKLNNAISKNSYFKVKGANGNFGLINHEGELIYDFIFTRIDMFCNGYSIVRLSDGDYGILNSKGAFFMFIKPYTEIQSLNEGFAVVHRFYGYDKQLYGYIDHYRSEKIPLIYHGAKEFSNGMAAVCNEKFLWGFIDNKGVQKVPFRYYNADSFAEGLSLVTKKIGETSHRYPIRKFGFINLLGEETIPLIYDAGSSFSEGLAIVGKNINGELFYGYINSSNEVVIPFKYVDAKPFSNGLAAVRIDYSDKYFLINNCGEQMTDPFELYHLYEFINDVAKIKIGNHHNEKFGLINKNGKLIIEPIYQRIEIVEDIILVSFEKNYHKYKFLADKNGDKLSNDYNEIFSFVEDIAPVSNYNIIDKYNLDFENPKYGFIDKKGNEISSCFFDKIIEFRDGFAGVMKDNKWWFINKKGETVSEKYDDICLFNTKGNVLSGSLYLKMIKKANTNFPVSLRFFYNNFALVINNNKYGLINSEGKLIISCIYDELKPNSTNMLICKLNGKYGLLRKDGFIISNPVYNYSFGFFDGLAACDLNGNWGFINEYGEIIIPFEYFNVGNFKNGLARVKINNLWGFINKKNEMIIKPQFVNAEDFELDNDGNIYAVVMKWDGRNPKNNSYLINSSGKIIENIN